MAISRRKEIKEVWEFKVTVSEQQRETTNETASGVVQARLQAVRVQLLEDLWRGMTLVALIAVPASLMRAQQTGWLPLYAAHALLAGLIVLGFVFRNALAYREKLMLLLAVYWAIGILGVFTLGLLGVGFLFLVLSGMVTSTFVSRHAGLYTAIGTGAVIGVAGLLFVSGTLVVPFDANLYVASLRGWANLVVVTSIVTYFFFSAFGIYQKTTADLLAEIQHQSDQIADLAGRDHLTGLPLGSLANDRLQVSIQSALRSKLKVALMFVDINNFKDVNDTLGHEAGDHVLQALANRLTKSVRAEDTVARIGGDEFLVILGNLHDRQEASPVAEKIVANMGRPIDHGGQSIICGASVGIAIFPDDAADATTLRRLADRAMYQVKRSGTNGYAYADGSTPLSDFGPDC